MHVSPHYLRRLSEGAQEGAAHAVTIGKTGLPSDDVDRVAALLHHQSGSLDAQILYRLRRRLAGLGTECSAELTRTQMRRCGELYYRQRFIKIALRRRSCGVPMSESPNSARTICSTSATTGWSHHYGSGGDQTRPLTRSASRTRPAHRRRLHGSARCPNKKTVLVEFAIDSGNVIPRDGEWAGEWTAAEASV
jgi:hypothetical protein